MIQSTMVGAPDYAEWVAWGNDILTTGQQRGQLMRQATPAAAAVRLAGVHCWAHWGTLHVKHAHAHALHMACQSAVS